MFGSLQPTPYDVEFSVAGVPVRVLPTFWLVSALMGITLLNEGSGGIPKLMIWVMVVFFSILLHELGHALTARLFGYPPQIFLYHFGGLAQFLPTFGYSTLRAVLILLAGPGAGFVLGAALIATDIFYGPAIFETHPLLYFALYQAIWVNVGWGLVNLLPVLPLDGGQICRELLTNVKPHRGEQWALKVSVAAGVLTALAAFQFRQTYIGFLFAFLAYNSLQGLQTRRPW